MAGLEGEGVEPLSGEELSHLPDKTGAFASIAGNCAQTSFGGLRDA